MSGIVLGLSRYVLCIFSAFFTFHCFLVPGPGERGEKGVTIFQAFFLMIIHIISFSVLYFRTGDPECLYFCALQEVMIVGYLVLMRVLYPGCSSLLINNMLFFLAVGLILLYRLSPENHMRQFVIAVSALVLSLPIPYLVKKIKEPWKYTYGFGLSGLILIFFVLIVGRVTRGSRLSLSIAGVSFQPSEFAKVLFILFLAGVFSEDCFFGDTRKDKELRLINIFAGGLFAMAYIVIMVLTKDLGGAAIFFVIFVMMLYLAVKKIYVPILAFLLGGAGLAICYKVFPHVRNRFLAWTDPFSYIEGQGYQITQSLFAIGTGSWFGMGLYEGSPEKIPIVERDFIFSAIAEEMGCIFALCFILICISAFLVMINAAMKKKDPYYRMVALGISVCYAFQVFLNIGGVTKVIPLTGVTLPLTSYGGSSLLTTVGMFAMIQGILICSEPGKN